MARRSSSNGSAMRVMFLAHDSVMFLAHDSWWIESRASNRRNRRRLQRQQLQRLRWQ